MKRIFMFLIAALFLAAGTSYAGCGVCETGKGSKSGDMVEKKMGKMTEALGLTDEQASEVKALMSEKMAKKEAVRAEAHEKKYAIHEEYSGKIRALLNEEQQVKFDAMKAKKGSQKGSGKKEKKGSSHEGHDHGKHDHGGDGEKKGS